MNNTDDENIKAYLVNHYLEEFRVLYTDRSCLHTLKGTCTLFTNQDKLDTGNSVQAL